MFILNSILLIVHGKTMNSTENSTMKFKRTRVYNYIPEIFIIIVTSLTSCKHYNYL